MHPIFVILIVVFSIVLLGLFLALYMITPGKKRSEMEKFKEIKYAHRGLHDATKAENSLSAFAAAKEKGLFRLEGKDYVMQDGDVTMFRFNI